jgi:hypothetical protein
MTKEQLDELERLEAEAQTAPWDEDWCYGAARHIARNVDWDRFFDGDGNANAWGMYDGTFIAKLRNHAPDLFALARDGLKWRELEEADSALKKLMSYSLALLIDELSPKARADFDAHFKQPLEKLLGREP